MTGGGSKEKWEGVKYEYIFLKEHNTEVVISAFYVKYHIKLISWE